MLLKGLQRRPAGPEVILLGTIISVRRESDRRAEPGTETAEGFYVHSVPALLLLPTQTFHTFILLLLLLLSRSTHSCKTSEAGDKAAEEPAGHCRLKEHKDHRMLWNTSSSSTSAPERPPAPRFHPGSPSEQTWWSWTGLLLWRARALFYPLTSPW